MSPLGIATYTAELPSNGRVGRRKRRRHIGVVGRKDAKPHEIEKAEVSDVVSEKAALLETKRRRAVRIHRRVDALIVPMIAPKSVGRICPIGDARTPQIGCRLPAGVARWVAVLAGDVRSRDETGDDRRYRRRGLTELLLPALRRRP